MRWFRFHALFAVALLALAGGAMAREPAAEPPTRAQQIAWKLTPTYLSSTRDAPAWDVNLRGNTDTQTWWAGYYRRQEEFEQLRVGYERPLEWTGLRLVPSFQYATRGFFGGSVNAEIGERNFGVLGWGRTNLKDYYNLNFDPNDAVTFGFGTRALPRTAIALYQVRDDRLDTGQRITHLVTRYKPTDKTRWTVDVFYKEGRPDSDPASARLHGTGAGVTYDFGPWFARVVTDPYVNFSDSHMVRVAFGRRF